MIEHTPLPYYSEADTIKSVYKPGYIAQVSLSYIDSKTHEANIRFIVQACNSYYDLVAALEECERALGIKPDFVPLGRAYEIAPKIRAALDKAKLP